MARLDSVGIAKQSAWGTKQTVMEFYPPVESAELSAAPEQLEVEETVGHRFPTDLEYGTQLWEVGVAGALRPTSAPRIFSAAFGAPTTSGPTDSAYTHTFDPAAAGKVPVPHSLLLNRTDPATAITDLVYDAIINELTLSVEPNGFVMFDAAFQGLANDDARPEPTVTADASARFTFDQAKAFLSIGGGGETEMKVSGWEMTYSNNVDSDYLVLGSRAPYALKEGNATCEFKFMPIDQSAYPLVNEYRRALKSDPDNVKLRLLVEGALIGSSSKWTLEVTGYRIHYLEAPASVSADEVLKNVEVTARAAYSTSDTKFVQVKIINATASY